MTVRIRLKKISRTAKGRYNFRVVVIKKTASRDSRPIEEIGYYDPSKNPVFIKINKERYDYWVSKGAQPTDTLSTLYKKHKESI